MTLDTNSSRGPTLLGAATLAILAAAFVLIFSVGHSDQAHASGMATPKVSAKAVAFRQTTAPRIDDARGGRPPAG